VRVLRLRRADRLARWDVRVPLRLRLGPEPEGRLVFFADCGDCRRRAA